MNILIKSAQIIDPNSSFHQQKKDILIQNGIIKKIDDSISIKEDCTEINLENLHVSNGWFDTSVSFGEPGYEDTETLANGLIVAGKSGFTDIAVQPDTQPINDQKSIVQFIKNYAINHPVNLHPIGALTQKSKGEEMAELFDMQQNGAIAFGDYKKSINANLLKIALLYAQNFDGLIMSFPKEDSVAQQGVANEGVNATKLGLKGIPNLAEELQIARDLFLLEYTGGKLHIPTISTSKSVDLIRDAKRKGLAVSCSVAIHNLVLTDAELQEFDSVFKVNPPLRTEADRLALVKGVEDGTIDIITSDHCPINIEDKKVPFSDAKDGTIGLESAFSVLATIFDKELIIKCIEENPKQIFGIEKTIIEEGEKAKLSLFNPEGKAIFEQKNILSTSKNSAFLGKEIKGTVYGICTNKLILK